MGKQNDLLDTARASAPTSGDDLQNNKNIRHAQQQQQQQQRGEERHQ